jgi:hypothetical protein
MLVKQNAGQPYRYWQLTKSLGYKFVTAIMSGVTCVVSNVALLNSAGRSEVSSFQQYAGSYLQEKKSQYFCISYKFRFDKYLPDYIASLPILRLKEAPVRFAIPLVVRTVCSITVMRIIGDNYAPVL